MTRDLPDYFVHTKNVYQEMELELREEYGKGILVKEGWVAKGYWKKLKPLPESDLVE